MFGKFHIHGQPSRIELAGLGRKGNGGGITPPIWPPDTDTVLQLLQNGYDFEHMPEAQCQVDRIQQPDYVDVNILTSTDTASDGVSAPFRMPLTGDFKVECHIRARQLDGFKAIWSQYISGDGRFILAQSFANVQVFRGGIVHIQADDVLRVNVWQKIKVTRTEGVWELFIGATLDSDYVSYGTAADAVPIADTNVRLGSLGGSTNNFLGDFRYFRFEGYATYECCEGNGAVLHDTSGQGNHATINPSVTWDVARGPASDDLIIDNGFDDPAQWFLGGASTVSGGRGNVTSLDNSLSYIRTRSIQTEVGKTYTVEYDVTEVRTAGTMGSNAGSVVLPATLGHHVVTFVAPDIHLYFKRTNVIDISIDNVHLYDAEISVPESYNLRYGHTPAVNPVSWSNVNYFDTGRKWTDNSRIVWRGYRTDDNASLGMIGAYKNADDVSAGLMFGLHSSYPDKFYSEVGCSTGGGNRVGTISSGQSWVKDQYAEIEIDSLGWTFNGEYTPWVSQASMGTIVPSNFMIGAVANATGATWPFRGGTVGMEWYESGVLVANYIATNDGQMVDTIAGNVLSALGPDGYSTQYSPALRPPVVYSSYARFDVDDNGTPPNFILGTDSDRKASFHIKIKPESSGTTQVVCGRMSGGSGDTDYAVLLYETGNINIYGTEKYNDVVGTFSFGEELDIWYYIDNSTKTEGWFINGVGGQRSFTSKQNATSQLKLSGRNDGGDLNFKGDMYLFAIYDGIVTLDGSGVSPTYIVDFTKQTDKSATEVDGCTIVTDDLSSFWQLVYGETVDGVYYSGGDGKSLGLLTPDGKLSYASFTPLACERSFVWEGEVLLPSDFEIIFAGGDDLFTGISIMVYEASGLPRYTLRSGTAEGTDYTQIISVIPTEHYALFDDQFHHVRIELLFDGKTVWHIDGEQVFTSTGWNNGLPDYEATFRWFGHHTTGSLGPGFSRASCKWFTLTSDSGTRSADFRPVIGKTATAIDDVTLEPNGNTIASMWNERYADPAGIQVDTINHEPLEWVGGYTHNNSEVGILQKDTSNHLNVAYRTGEPDESLPYNGNVSGLPSYLRVADNYHVAKSLSEWNFVPVGGGAPRSYNPTNSALPPVNNWVSIAIVPYQIDRTSLIGLLVGQANFWSDGSAYDIKYYADIATHGNGANNLWIRQACVNSNPHIEVMCQYMLNKIFTAEDIERLTQIYTWCDPESGAIQIEYDADLTIEYNADGSIEYVQSK